MPKHLNNWAHVYQVCLITSPTIRRLTPESIEPIPPAMLPYSDWQDWKDKFIDYARNKYEFKDWCYYIIETGFETFIVKG